MNPVLFGDRLYFAIETPVSIDGVETFFLSGTEGPFFFQVPDAVNVAAEWFFRWEDYAESFGGNLVTINTLDELNFLGSQYAQQSNESGVLTGLYENQSNEYVWTSGDVFSVPPSITGYPVSFDSDGDRREDYIAIYFKSTDGKDFSATEWNDVGANSAMLPSTGIVEIPLNLSITTSSTPAEGSGIFTTSINLSAGTEASGNLAEGANVYWQISGITAEDLASGALSGSGFITDGKLSIDHSLVNDADSGETFNVSVFSDVENTQQIGTTAEFLIQEENNAPTDIGISATSFDENIPAGSVVGSFSTTDPDSGDTFSYSLVDDATTTISGVEVTDNALFTIDGNQLKINESPDFESKQSYDIRVQTTDSAGLFFQKEFTLGVNDLEEQIDPITGILGTPNQIKLRNSGRVKFTLFGSDDINVREIDLDSLIFGGDQNALTSETPLDGDYFEVAKRNKGKREGTFIAKFKDVNGDGKDDLITQALNSEVSSVMDRGDTELFAYAQIGDGTILFENTDVSFI
jgi:hypothetical protein